MSREAMSNKPKTERNNRVLALHYEGKSYLEIVFTLIAEGYGKITPQRVGKIIQIAKGAK